MPRNSTTVSTKQKRIAALAKQSPEMAFTSLAYLMDIDWLKEAYRRTRKDGAVGVDGVTAEEYEQDLEGNLQSLLDRAKSGTYKVPPVRRVHIPKGGSSTETRPLGIPTLEDKLLQRAVVMLLEPLYEQDFLDCSYGFRPGRSAHQALKSFRDQTMNGRPQGGWVYEVDIRKFFDNLDWDLVMRAVRHHTDAPWILLYVERWLKAPVQHADGRLEERTKGSPQGSVISPLLSNLFMHYAFDEWLRRNFADVQFARYADDAVVHARSRKEAEALLAAIRQRLAECRLELHPEKTKIVYCQDDDRRGTHEHTSFDFLGYTFRPRRAKNRWGKLFISFLPGVSNKAANSIRATIRSWRIGGTRNNQSLEEIAKFVNPFVRGWVNYYGRYYPSALTPVLRSLERSLVYWVRRKFKRLRNHPRRAVHWLGRVAQREPQLFTLWAHGIRPATGQ